MTFQNDNLPDKTGLDAYSFSAADVQAAYENRTPAGSSFHLTHCAFSGLRLGYLPTRKLAFRGEIAWNALSEHDCLIALQCALHTEPFSDERKFAFCALIRKIPSPELIEWRTHHLAPAWKDRKLGNLLTNHGLQTLAEFVETITTLPPRILDLLPRFRVEKEFHTDNTTLYDFPTALAKWILAIRTSKQTEEEIRASQRQDSAAERLNPFRLFVRRKARDEKRSIFEHTVSTQAEITLYARMLGEFYELRSGFQEWESFVRNPSMADARTIRKAIDRARECNASDDGTVAGDELLVSAQFIDWLETHYIRREAEQQANKKILSILSSKNDYALLVKDVDLAEIAQRTKELDEQFQKPVRERFPSMSAWMDAMSAWRAGPHRPTGKR